jgi:hypothetical protein
LPPCVLRVACCEWGNTICGAHARTCLLASVQQLPSGLASLRVAYPHVSYAEEPASEWGMGYGVDMRNLVQEEPASAAGAGS